MVRKENGSSRALVTAIALIMAVAVGALRAPAYAQVEQPGAQATGAPQASPSPQVPQPEEGGVNWSGVGYGAGAVAGNVLYIPAKVVYAVLGGLVGGASYVLTGGNSQTADTIWRSSLGGDYVITPGMLEGKEELHFNGPTQTSPAQASVQPINPGPSGPSPAASSSSAPAAAPAAAGTPSSGSVTSQPIDSGATGAGQGGDAPPATLPDTSIE